MSENQVKKPVLLPKNIIEQKLNREFLPNYCSMIKNEVKELYSSGVDEFILSDGPAFSNGALHIGHFLNKTIKDFYIKYLLSTGYKVKVRFGWDCHGLPIENKAKQQEGDLIENCKNTALLYREKQKETLSKFGIFSTEEDYLTLEEDFEKRELEIFNKLKDGGYIFKKNKPTWYSPTLKTVLANSEIEYKDIQDESVYFKFPVSRFGYELLVWTTTEWTVSGNQAVCLNKNISYCKTKDGLICSEKFARINNFEFDLFDITGLIEYENYKREKCPILFDDFVMDSETGIVHLCGGHGDDDYSVLVKNGIEPKNVVENINELQEYINTSTIPSCWVYKRVELNHSYPVDWREKNKVYKVLTEQTYLEFDWTKIKAVSKQIKLSTKDRSRLESMLFSRKDWCLSRQRKWGVKIPDSNDILDVWFDSGTVFSMYDEPSDLYIEGVDQYRGWFQSSIIIAAMIDRVPTKRILAHGFVTNDMGEKFSKSSENYTPLDEMYDLYNPDVMRLWVLFSDYKNDVVLSEEAMKSAGKQYFRLRNFVRYLVNNLHRENHSADNVREDLKNKIQSLKVLIKTNSDSSEINKAVRGIVDFTNNYSSFLSEDIKNKFYESEINSEFRIQMENEFYYLTTELSVILFPFVPFLSVELKSVLK